MNYLIDKAVYTGKEANSIINTLRHFLSTQFWRGQPALHALESVGGLNKEDHYFFPIVGYTKFSPHWCFGHFIQHYRRSKIRCLARVVERSAAVNYARLVRKQDGAAWLYFFDRPGSS